MGRIGGDLKSRTLNFGIQVLRVVKEMPNETIGWVVGKQLARSATSIGANVWEADAALTESEFANKISIARKEASETLYWLELASRSELIFGEKIAALQSECHELTLVLGTVVRKTQEHIRQR